LCDYSVARFSRVNGKEDEALDDLPPRIKSPRLENVFDWGFSVIVSFLLHWWK
jgi:hypothetical protein